MFKALKRWWKYLAAKLSGKLEERADPKVQLEQAISEAQEQHRKLREQAANVIANQKQLEMHLSRTMAELEKANGNARQALVMSSDATRSGDVVKAQEYDGAAESIATRLIELEKSVDEQKVMVLQATQAADQAKAAVQQNSVALQRKLAERQKLLSQLDQAKMQEQLNTAMATLSESVGQDVPTFDEVRDKIEARYAKAKGMAELQETTVESRMLEIEQASTNSEARGRLEQMRAELGIPAKTTGAVEPPAIDGD
ncbi:MAG TPA: PspA/IM30 family protein [Acidimicrobiales bacterium]|nr:PspA/IM30 family protein [Acidimicrobiales bacterium]